MEVSVERECSALGGLFQQIIADMKNGTPLWEDFIAKATKLHSCLRTTIQAIASYLDSFQKIADAATNSRGATKEIGTALTRICMRHKAVEARMKTFTSAIMDCLILPLQEKIEDWKKIVINLDKEHTKEYKKARSELKKRSTDTLRLQKKVKKGKCGELQRRFETSLQDVSERRHFLEKAEKKALRAALIEERSRFCLFVGCFKPVVNEEIAMLSELTHIQEMAEQLDKISADPYILPPSSEQVIQDLKGSDGLWSFQTPPSSPSSLGSRKSSMCSISSLNSSSSGSNKSQSSPNHFWQRSTSQSGPLSSGTLPRLSSISSQDSGYRSQDALFPKHSQRRFQVSNISGKSDNSNSSTPSTPHIKSVIVPTTTSTWPNLQETLQFERAASAIMKERPHTISSAYERGHQRPCLTVFTFHAPEASLSQPASPVSANTNLGNSNASSSPLVIYNNPTPHASLQAIYSRPPIPQRCSSLERPSVPSKSFVSNRKTTKTESKITSLRMCSRLPTDDVTDRPTYVNMNELACMAASKAQEMKINIPQLLPVTKLFEEKDGSNHESLLESSGNTSDDATASCKSLQNKGYLTDDTVQNIKGMKVTTIGQKPPPPIRRTASISNTSAPAFLGNSETTTNSDNLPPPPLFLLDEGSNTENVQLPSTVRNAQTVFQNVSLQNSSYSSSQETDISPRSIRVAETVRTLTELKHTPASPSAVRRSPSVSRSQSAERRESIGSGLIAALNAKIAPNMSPRHSRRHSEDTIRKNISQGYVSPLSGKLVQRGLSSPGKNFLESLNAKLAIQQNQLKINNAAKVRQLFAEKTVSDPSVCHDSLMDQIKKGTPLKKTGAINDRSAPKIH